MSNHECFQSVVNFLVLDSWWNCSAGSPTPYFTWIHLASRVELFPETERRCFYCLTQSKPSFLLMMRWTTELVTRGILGSVRFVNPKTSPSLSFWIWLEFRKRNCLTQKLNPDQSAANHRGYLRYISQVQLALRENRLSSEPRKRESGERKKKKKNHLELHTFPFRKGFNEIFKTKGDLLSRKPNVSWQA